MVDSGDPSRHYGVRYRIRDEIARSWLRRVAPRPNGSGFVSGAALLIARADFDRIGGFDEEYFLFYEDIDLCLRANAAGIGTFVDERFTVRHSGAHSTSAAFRHVADVVVRIGSSLPPSTRLPGRWLPLLCRGRLHRSGRMYMAVRRTRARHFALAAHAARDLLGR